MVLKGKDEDVLVELKVIKSVTELIDFINDNENKKYLFRGENREYDEQRAGAFRRNRRVNGQIEYPFDTMIHEFSREIENPVCEDEILAFAQHSGLPTNLLDITSNPLISLYFASLPSLSKENGYIYMLDMENTIDITDTVQKLGTKNLLTEVYFCNKDIIKSFVRNLATLKDIVLMKYMDQLKKDFKNTASELLRDGEDVILDFNNTISVKQASIDKYDYIPKNYDAAIDYVIYLQTFLSCCRKHHLFADITGGLPLMIYSPVMSFKRGINQQSHFIYQNYFSYNDDRFNYTYLGTQSIKFTNQIIIDNNAKEDILHTLDLLNVNQKFIFNDADSIAEYILNKYK